jgi:hypothetical protein
MFFSLSFGFFCTVLIVKCLKKLLLSVQRTLKRPSLVIPLSCTSFPMSTIAQSIYNLFCTKTEERQKAYMYMYQEIVRFIPLYKSSLWNLYWKLPTLFWITS